jgi:4-hydroxybenzoate polyprenyltransferase
VADRTTKGSTARLRRLDRELDQERALQIAAAAASVIGVALAVTVNSLFALLAVVALVLLAQYAIQGWCPAVPLLALLGLRSSREIDGERYLAAAEVTEPPLLEQGRAGAD